MNLQAVYDGLIADTEPDSDGALRLWEALKWVHDNAYARARSRGRREGWRAAEQHHDVTPVLRIPRTREVVK